MAEILATDHLILPAEVVGPACEKAEEMRDMQISWLGGGTSLGNALWDNFITPSATDADALARSRNYRPALAELMGLLLYMQGDDGWLCDQEVYCDWPEFKRVFTRISFAWKTLLAQSDAVLGLAPSLGRTGGYRAALREILGAWEKATNATLEETFDEHVPAWRHSKGAWQTQTTHVQAPVRLTIFS